MKMPINISGDDDLSVILNVSVDLNERRVGVEQCRATSDFVTHSHSHLVSQAAQLIFAAAQ